MAVGVRLIVWVDVPVWEHTLFAHQAQIAPSIVSVAEVFVLAPHQWILGSTQTMLSILSAMGCVQAAYSFFNISLSEFQTLLIQQ